MLRPRGDACNLKAITDQNALNAANRLAPSTHDKRNRGSTRSRPAIEYMSCA
ncbi:hypothetical protein D3C81_2333760 [compost metagenome]